MCAGLLTGHADIALPLGVIFELFWLDVIPLGAVIPPVASLNFFLVFCLALIFDWHSPAQFMFPLLLTLPCAYAGAMVERWQYARNNLYLAPLHQWMMGQDAQYSPAHIVLFSLVHSALLQGVLFLVLFSLAYAVILLGSVEHWFTALCVQAQVSWTLLYGLAAIGAIVALRTRRAYAVLVSSIAILLVCNGLGLF